MIDGLALPFTFWIFTRNALAGFRILDEALSIVDDRAAIKLVVQNAVATLR